MSDRAAPFIDRINAWIRERDRIGSAGPIPIMLNASVPRGLRIGLGATLLALSTVYLAIWSKPYGGFAAARAAMALIVIGSALLLGSRLLKKEEPLSTGEGAPGSPWLLLLGCPNNLAVAQLVSVVVMIVFGARREIDEAWWAAVIAVLLVVPLYRSRATAASVAMAAAGLLYLLYSFAVDGIERTITADAYARELPEFIVPLSTIFWVAVAIALIPQLQLIRVGAAGIGRFRGDTSVRLFGSQVPVAFTSSALLVSLYGAVPALFYLPTSIRVAFGG